jgi:hypothetical protein
MTAGEKENAVSAALWIAIIIALLAGLLPMWLGRNKSGKDD